MKRTSQPGCRRTLRWSPQGKNRERARAKAQGRREENPEEGKGQERCCLLERVKPHQDRTRTPPGAKLQGCPKLMPERCDFAARRRRNGARPDSARNGAFARSRIRAGGRVESVDQERKEAVKGREQRRSIKDRRRSRLGEVSDSEGQNPTSASGAEQTRRLLLTECLPGG